MAKPDSRKSLTQSDIEIGLRKIGVNTGQVIEVHSALSSLGNVVNGPVTVVNALMNVIGNEGTIVMSAYPVCKPLPLTEEEKNLGILAKVQTYSEDYAGRTGMGAISDEFCRQPGTVLGKGFHRVCAWGRDAEKFSQGYEVLLEADGWVLLLGVDIERCSCMHQAETIPIPPEIARYFAIPAEIRQRYPDDYYIAYGQTPLNVWKQIQSQAEEQKIIKIGQIGEATCRFFKARPVVDMYATALRVDPWSLYGVKKVD